MFILVQVLSTVNGRSCLESFDLCMKIKVLSPFNTTIAVETGTSTD